MDAANTATTDGTAQQAEITQLLSELDAIGTRTKFAGNAVFQNYTGTPLTFQVGASSGDTLTISSDLRVSAAVLGVNGLTVDGTTAGDAAAAIGTIDTAIASVSSTRSTLGATQNRLEHTIANLSVAVENLSASESRVRDTDMALEMVTFTRNQIMSQAGTAMLAQANQVPSSVLTLLR